MALIGCGWRVLESFYSEYSDARLKQGCYMRIRKKVRNLITILWHEINSAWNVERMSARIVKFCVIFCGSRATMTSVFVRGANSRQLHILHKNIALYPSDLLRFSFLNRRVRSVPYGFIHLHTDMIVSNLCGVYTASHCVQRNRKTTTLKVHIMHGNKYRQNSI